MNIYLIGYRASGKTTIGRALAEKLGYLFLDVDEEIVKQSGISISEMVKKHGWNYFRQQEKKTIKELSKLSYHIVATGGGVILNRENIDIIKKKV